MKVLVTGAGGFVGQAVTSSLVDANWEVRALVRRSEVISMAHPGLEWVVGDIRNPAFLDQVVDGVDYIVHLAAAKSDEAESYAINVEGTQHLIDAARAHGVKGFILLSTISAKFATRGIYGETKLQAERVTEASGFPTVVLRSSVIYGELSDGIMGTILNYAKLPLVPVLGPGTPTVNPIRVDDVALAIEKILSRSFTGYALYDLGGPDEISLDELTRVLATRVVGRKTITLVHIPAWLGLLIVRAGKLVGMRILTESNVLGANQHARVEHEVFDNAYAFSPRPLLQDIEDMMQDAHQSNSEAHVLLSYLSNKKISDYYANLYDRSVEKYGLGSHPLPSRILSSRWRLAALDAVTRLRNPQGIVQKKLRVAAAVYEASPASAVFLKERGLIDAFTMLAWAGMASAWFLMLGMLFLPAEARVLLHE